MPTLVDRVPRAALEEEVRNLMSASVGSEGRLAVGAEVELIPLRIEDQGRLALDRTDGIPGIVDLVGRAGDGQGWLRERTSGGVPRFRIPGVGFVTFEPGGQLEISTRPYPRVDDLVHAVEGALGRIFEAGDALGIQLVTRGMDPVNPADGASLLITSDRYRKQSEHYQAIGPWGRRMMRQSAAIHVNVDLGGRPARRWGVANRMAAAMTALFANSPRYGGRETGCRSFRAEQWRHLDPTRTGVFSEGSDPAGAYTDFALNALDFLAPPQGGPSLPFRESWAAGASLDAWREHLTTVFPEVRPRGYLELRSFDTLRPAWVAAPLVLVSGILYEPGALAQAEELLPPAEAGLLVVAGRSGLRSPEIRASATELFELGLRGAERLGEEVVGGAALEVARAYRERFVARGEDPGDEPDHLDPFER
jgi:glutamate--cysteine ligase